MVSGCATTPELGGKAAAISLEVNGKQVALQEGTEAYGALASWRAANQSGWTPLMATPSWAGLRVKVGTDVLNFQQTSVLFHTAKGYYVKACDALCLGFVQAAQKVPAA